jgi:AcrR family transcriptional regulator
MSSQENPPLQPARRPRGRPKMTTPSQYSPGLPRDHPMESLPPTARSILEAARRVLAERGLEGLTIEAVANEANVSRTLIPYHFGSRAGLVAILFDSLFHDLAVSVYGLAGPGGSLPTFLDWIKREADDTQSQHDFFELIVSALREPELQRRIAGLYDDYRELVLEMTGVSEPVDPSGPDPAGRVSDAQRRELAAVGSVLVAIEDGLGLQAALDPAFDVDGALAMVETMLGAALARLKSTYEPEAPATR